MGGKSNAVIYEGEKAEEYKKQKNKWIRLAVAGTGLPSVLGVLVTIFNDTFSLLDLFGNGELILLLFSLTLPMAFDLFDEKEREDERLSWAFWNCIIIICLQVALYCLIRMGHSSGHEFKSIAFSLIMMILSWLECNYAIKAKYYHSIERDGGESNAA